LLAIALAVVAGFVFLPAPRAELIEWQPYDATVISSTLNQDRPVLVKFTADWCLSCKAVERIVYGRRDIAELINHKNVLTIKADTTESNYPATLALKNLYSEPGVPVSILFMPGLKEPVKWRGILFVDELKQSLQGLPDVKPRPDMLR
jgi:thiol:disulfide interchange protein DsbD